MEAVDIDEGDLLDLGLGRSIYTKEQVEEFLKFQDSQGTRWRLRSWLTEDAVRTDPGDSASVTAHVTSSLTRSDGL